MDLTNAAELDRYLTGISVFEAALMTGAPEADAADIARYAARTKAEQQFMRSMRVFDWPPDPWS